MKLLREEELVWSDVVANTRMNRKRKASGVNSYQKELKFSPELFLNTMLEKQQQVKWLDLCCGEGGALLQYANSLAQKALQDRAILRGIDLVDHFQPIPENIKCVSFQVGSLVDWSAEDQYDLITCVHGLHYVGDKLKVLAEACKAIAKDGLLIANLDLKSIKVEGDAGNARLNGLLQRSRIEYNARRKVVVCKGSRELLIDIAYLGANDKAGPNYTGQEAVDSHYTMRNPRREI